MSRRVFGAIALVMLLVLGLTLAGAAWRHLGGAMGGDAADSGERIRQAYVATTGNDDSAGHSDSPVASLPAALARVAPNGSVTIRGGTYPITGPVVIDQPGVTIQPAAGAHVVFDGSRAVQSAELRPDGDLVSIDYQPQPANVGEGLTLANLPSAVTSEGSLTEVARSAGWSCVTTDTGYASPTPEPSDAVGCPEGRPTVIQGYFPDQAWSGDRPLRQVLNKDQVGPGRFYVSRSSDTDADPPPGQLLVAAEDAADLRVSDSAGDFLVVAADDVTISGVTVRRHSPDWASVAIRVQPGVSGTTLRDLALRDIASTPLKLAGTWRDSDGLVSDTTLTGVDVQGSGWLASVILYADDTSVTGSTFSNSDPWGEFAGGPQVGGMKITKSHRLTIADSDVSQNAGHGIWVDQSSYDVAIANSTIIGNSGAGVFFEISHGLILANNLILAGSEDPAIRLAGSSGLQLVNNTVVGGSSSVAVLTDFRSRPFSPGRPCAEHPVRYGQEAPLASCGIEYASDLDRARSGEFGTGPNLTPGMKWYPQVDLMINNVLADSTGPRFCTAQTALCVKGSTARGDQVTAVGLNTVFTAQTGLDGNVYQDSGVVAAFIAGPEEPGEFEAVDLQELRGTDGLGSPYYGLDVEQHGASGHGFVDSAGRPTSILKDLQGQASPVPADLQLNAFVPAGSRNHGASPEVLDKYTPSSAQAGN